MPNVIVYMEQIWVRAVFRFWFLFFSFGFPVNVRGSFLFTSALFEWLYLKQKTMN